MERSNPWDGERSESIQYSVREFAFREGSGGGRVTELLLSDGSGIPDRASGGEWFGAKLKDDPLRIGRDPGWSCNGVAASCCI